MAISMVLAGDLVHAGTMLLTPGLKCPSVCHEITDVLTHLLGEYLCPIPYTTNHFETASYFLCTI